MSEAPSFQMSADTRFILQRLRKAAVGDVVTYEDLSKEIGSTVHGGLPALSSARRVMLKEDRVVFDAVRGVGIKRLNDTEIVSTSSGTASRIRKAAQRGVRKLTAVSDFSRLTRDQQMRHTAAVSVFGVVAEMTTTRGLTKVEKVAEGHSGELPISQTLAAFRK